MVVRALPEWDARPAELAIRAGADREGASNRAAGIGLRDADSGQRIEYLLAFEHPSKCCFSPRMRDRGGRLVSLEEPSVNGSRVRRLPSRPPANPGSV